MGTLSYPTLRAMTKNLQISFWEHDTWLRDIDVAIIGSGIVGLNAALNLKTNNPALRVIILERGSYPYGASTRNAGFACFGTLSELVRDIQSEGAQIAFENVRKRHEGLQLLRKIIGDDVMDFEMTGSGELFFDDVAYNAAVSQLEAVNKLLHSYTGLKENFSLADDRIRAHGFGKATHLIHSKHEGLIHSGKMMHALLQKVREAGVSIFNNVNVTDIEDDEGAVTLRTDPALNLRCRKVLITTNGFTARLVPDIDVSPARGQLLVTAPIDNLKVHGAFHFEEGYYYFRHVGNRILFGGGRNLDIAGETTSEMGITQQIQQQLEYYLREVIIPGTPYAIDHRWSGIMGMGSKRTVIETQISTNVFCAARLSGTGIAIGSLVGRDAAEMLKGSL